MDRLTCTILGDGPSDDALVPILQWLVARLLPDAAVQWQWADLRGLRQRPAGLAERIQRALELYPCDLLFVHRDAERDPPDWRIREVDDAIRTVSAPPRHVCVVPVRMTEAWCLFDEAAIRRAAGNPNGRMPLQLPRHDHVEGLPDPKETLRSLLRTASGLKGRRLKDFNIPPRRVTALIDDFGPLQRLAAFQRLEAELKTLLTNEDPEGE